MSSLTALKAIVRKDLILFLSDRRALLITLVLPILLGTFFGYLFGGSGVTKNARIDVGLVMIDDSDIGKNIAAGLKADKSISILELKLEEAQEQVRKGKLHAAIVIPAGFGAAAGAALFSSRDKPEITVYYDPSQNALLAVVKGLLTQQVMQTVSAEMFGGKTGMRFIEDSIKQSEQRAANDPDAAELNKFLQSLRRFQGRTQGGGAAANAASPTAQNVPQGLSMPFATREEAMSSGPKYNGYAHSFAGMSVQFILMMGIDAGIGILLARRMGLWSRLLAAPITTSTLLLARAISCALIAFGLLCCTFLFAVLVFEVKIAGSLPGFLGVGACFAVMTATFGLLIAAYGKTPEAARGLAVFATLLMVMLGGAWVPAFLFPQWLQTISLGLPTRWAVDGLDAMTWRGLDFSAAVPAMLVQLGFAALFGVIALRKFQRDQS
ncbi:MAG: ABC-2 transporter permease [Rhodocyclaceae bacterium]|nr:MAG: ABC-2 transporter permease [Rhodocyclaceae bacterium]